MLNIQSNTKSPHPAVKATRKVASKSSAAPVIVVPAPHPIFGKALTIPGFELKRQQMRMLNFWHKKAVEASEAYWAAPPKNKPDDDPEYDAIYNAKWDTFEAAFCASITLASELDALMQIVMRHAADSGDEELVTSERIAVIAGAAAKIAEPIQPKKRIGMLSRGKTLTRAGLLFRYQSFLMQELQTLSYELYGERDFATTFVAYDTAVDRRCKNRKRSHPFFDPTTLTARARTVLKSLKIDSKNADTNVLRMGGVR